MCPFCRSDLRFKEMTRERYGHYCQECDRWFSPFDSTPPGSPWVKESGMNPKLRVYVSSSWKNQARTREIAELIRSSGHEAFDFTDSTTRGGTTEIPPEMLPKSFDPSSGNYRTYLHTQPGWEHVISQNRRALNWCNVVVMLLPCGHDAHADSFYGLGRGAALAIVGKPEAGERTPNHLWADVLLDNDGEIVPWLQSIARSNEIWQRVFSHAKAKE